MHNQKVTNSWYRFFQFHLKQNTLSKSVELWEKGNLRELYSYNINIEDWGYKVVKGSLITRISPYNCHHLFDSSKLGDRGVEYFDEIKWKLSSFQTYIEIFKRRKQKNKNIFFCDIEDYKNQRSVHQLINNWPYRPP